MRYLVLFLGILMSQNLLASGASCRALPEDCNPACDSSCNYKRRATGNFSLFTQAPHKQEGGSSQIRYPADSNSTGKLVVWEGRAPSAPAGYVDPSLIPFSITFPDDTWNAISAGDMTYTVRSLPVDTNLFPGSVREQIVFVKSGRLSPSKENAQYYTATYQKCVVATKSGAACPVVGGGGCPLGTSSIPGYPKHCGKCELNKDDLVISTEDGSPITTPADFGKDQCKNICTPDTHCANYVKCAYQTCSGTSNNYYYGACNIGGGGALPCGVAVSYASCPPDTPTFMCRFVSVDSSDPPQAAFDKTLDCDSAPATPACTPGDKILGECNADCATVTNWAYSPLQKQKSNLYFALSYLLGTQANAVGSTALDGSTSTDDGGSTCTSKTITGTATGTQSVSYPATCDATGLAASQPCQKTCTKTIYNCGDICKDVGGNPLPSCY